MEEEPGTMAAEVERVEQTKKDPGFVLDVKPWIERKLDLDQLYLIYFFQTDDSGGTSSGLKGQMILIAWIGTWRRLILLHLS